MALFCRLYFLRQCDLPMLIRNCTISKVEHDEYTDFNFVNGTKHDEYTGFNLVNCTGCTFVYKTND